MHPALNHISKLPCSSCQGQTLLHLQGSIDQVDGMIRFDAHSEELLHWDDQIQSICNQLNNILEGTVARNIQAH